MRTLIVLALLSTTALAESPEPIDPPSVDYKDIGKVGEKPVKKLHDGTWVCHDEGPWKNMTIRKWTTVFGEKIDLAYVRFNPSSNEITLRAKNGVQHRIPGEYLQPQDRIWAKNEHRARKKFRRYII